MRQIGHGLLLVALAAGIFGLLPRLGGLTRDAAGLRHARIPFLVAAVVSQAISLGCYAQLYRQVLKALGARLRFRLAADVVLASFFVSHLTPFGSATGTLVAITVGYGAPRSTAVLAVLGYRIVNYWLPLIPGAVAYLRGQAAPWCHGPEEARGTRAIRPAREGNHVMFRSMKWPLVIAAAVVCAAAAAIALWVTDAPLLGHWLQIHTGTINESGPYYGFWSGFGSDLEEFGILGAVGAAIYQLVKKYNCHEPGVIARELWQATEWHEPPGSEPPADPELVAAVAE